MINLYIFALALGLPVLLWVVLAGADAEAPGDGPFFFISLSTLLFMVTFFGGGGLVATWMGLNVMVTLVMALSVGVLAAGLNHSVFSWLRRTEASSEVYDHEIEGSVARVSIPVSKRKKGRVVLDVAGVRTQMTAKTVDDRIRMQKGDRVIIVGIESNVALITPIAPELQ